MAHIRVAMVELMRREKCAAWEAGAEYADRQNHAYYHGGTYWGWPASKDNPHRRVEETP